MSAAAARARGVMHLRLGRPQAAVDDFCEALSFDPDDADGHAWLALALLASRRLETARIEAELAVGIAAESPLPLYALGRVRTGERRWKEAVEILERLVALEPEDADNHVALADALELAGRHDDARKALESARAVAPASPAVLSSLASLALERNDLAAAEELATAALGEAPEHAASLIVMGNVRLRRGDTDAAWDCAASVLRSHPNHEGATALIVAVKARKSWLLGAWWRYHTWMIGLGGRAVVALLVMFAVYKVSAQVAEDFGPEGAGDVIRFLWLGVAAYTWFGPALFKQRLDAELAPVALKKDF